MTARTPTQRAQDALRRRTEAGGRVVRVILSPPATAALDSLRRQYGLTMTAVLDRLLVSAGKLCD